MLHLEADSDTPSDSKEFTELQSTLQQQFEMLKGEEAEEMKFYRSIRQRYNSASASLTTLPSYTSGRAAELAVKATTGCFDVVLFGYEPRTLFNFQASALPAKEDDFEAGPLGGTTAPSLFMGVGTLLPLINEYIKAREEHAADRSGPNGRVYPPPVHERGEEKSGVAYYVYCLRDEQEATAAAFLPSPSPSPSPSPVPVFVARTGDRVFRLWRGQWQLWSGIRFLHGTRLDASQLQKVAAVAWLGTRPPSSPTSTHDKSLSTNKRELQEEVPASTKRLKIDAAPKQLSRSDSFDAGIQTPLLEARGNAAINPFQGALDCAKEAMKRRMQESRPFYLPFPFLASTMKGGGNSWKPSVFADHTECDYLQHQLYRVMRQLTSAANQWYSAQKRRQLQG